MHAFTLSDFHQSDHLFDFTFSDTGAQAVIHTKHLRCQRPPLSISAGDESLRNNGFTNIGKLGDDLLLLIGRENIDESVNRLWGIDGMEGGDDEVAGFGGGEGDADGFQIAELGDDDDIRVLTE